MSRQCKKSLSGFQNILVFATCQPKAAGLAKPGRHSTASISLPYNKDPYQSI